MVISCEQVGRIAIEEVDLKKVSDSQIQPWIKYDSLMNLESLPTPFELSRLRLRIRNLPDSPALARFCGLGPGFFCDRRDPRHFSEH